MREERLDRIEAKIDRIDDKLAEIGAHLAAQRVSLKEIAKDVSDNDKRLRPVEKHVSRVEGAIKLLSIAAVALGIIKTVLTLSASQ
jgi:predicted  nucleic acid-binding Zn-ribbon protein